MKTGLLVMILSALFLCCGCGKSNNGMSKSEMRAQIIQEYSRYIPKEYILEKLGEGSSQVSDTSVMLTLQGQNRMEIYDAFLRDVEKYLMK